MPTEEDFEHCRTFRHPWETIDVAEGESFDGRVSELRLRCTSCTSWRYDTFNVFGDLVAREYHYADGYRPGKNDERLTLAELRLRVVKRVERRASPQTDEE